MNIFEHLRMDSGEVDEKIRAQIEMLKANLAKEGVASKEMLSSYYRFSRNEASKDELIRANRQFRRFLKAMGLGALCVLPGSFVTVPAIIRVAKKAGIDLFPDALNKEKYCQKTVDFSDDEPKRSQTERHSA